MPNGRDLVYDIGRPVNIWKLVVPGGPPTQLTFDRQGASFTKNIDLFIKADPENARAIFEKYSL
jgi:hypothetical protein